MSLIFFAPRDAELRPAQAVDAAYLLRRTFAIGPTS